MVTSNQFVVIVEISLVPSASRADIKKLLVNNALTSIENEPGCHRFDVIETNDAHVPFILYEIYKNEAAFSDHLSSPHYLEFSAAADQYFENKKIRSGSLLNETSSLVE